MTLSESTKKGLRTVYQGILALVVVIPTLVAALPTSWVRVATIGGTVAGAVAVVAKVMNALEDKGVIPAFMRDVTTATMTKTTTVAVDSSDVVVGADTDALLDYS